MRPLYLKLRDDLRQAMLQGRFTPGGRLPSTRALAASLGVSRNTVIAAYSQLRREGLLSARQGAPSQVAIGRTGPKSRDLQFLLRNSHFPVDPVPLQDPDGTPLYVHR